MIHFWAEKRSKSSTEFEWKKLMMLLQNSSLFSSPYTGHILLICIILTVKICKHETSVLNYLFCFVLFSKEFSLVMGWVNFWKSSDLFSWCNNQICLMLLVQFSLVAQSCPTLCNPMNCSTPGLPVHRQILEST